MGSQLELLQFLVRQVSRMFARYIKKVDGVSKEEHHGNLIGGIVSLIGYILVLVYLVIYITSVQNQSYPITTGVAQFPNTEDTALTLPPINCVSPNGCYIKSQKMGDQSCIFLQQGQALPEEYRKLYYTSDPYEMFQVLSTDHDKNFALSFDFETVTEYTNPLKTSTLEAAVDFEPTVPMPYKIFRGLNTFNLIRTVGVDGEIVDTWSAQLTKDESSFQGTGTCCGSSQIYDVNGDIDQDAVNTMTQCTANYNADNTQNNWWTTILVPPATYSEVTVIDPLDVSTVLGLIGGWASVAMAGLAVIYHLIHDTGIISPNSEWFKANDDEPMVQAKEQSLEMASSI